MLSDLGYCRGGGDQLLMSKVKKFTLKRTKQNPHHKALADGQYRHKIIPDKRRRDREAQEREIAEIEADNAQSKCFD